MWAAAVAALYILLNGHLSSATLESGGVANLSHQHYLEDILQNRSYDRSHRPFNTNDGKTKVLVQIRINGISDVDQVSQDFSVEMMLRLFWVDARLSHNLDRTVVLSSEGHLWQPDIYFPNEKTSHLHNLIAPNLVYFVYADGSVIHSRRLAVKFSCNMDIRAFPMDTQICYIRAESYSWNNEYMVLHWFDEDNDRFIEFSGQIDIPAFRLASVWKDVCEENVYISGTYSCLVANLKFERRFNLYFLNTYVPSLFVVIMSWLTFWIDVKVIAARVSVGLLTVLTMSTQTSSILSSLPPVAYIKAMDIWMCACLVFVFAAFLETAVVQMLDFRSTKCLNNPVHSGKTGQNAPRPTRKPSLTEEDLITLPAPAALHLTASSLDVFCRIAFPVCCSAFCSVYFVIYIFVLE